MFYIMSRCAISYICSDKSKVKVELKIDVKRKPSLGAGGVGCIPNKSENATLLTLVKMAERRFLFQFRFCKTKRLTSSYNLHCTCV